VTAAKYFFQQKLKLYAHQQKWRGTKTCITKSK